MKTVCLIGNGVSIAEYPGLAIPKITERLLDKFKGSGDATLRSLANNIGSTHEGFEALLGPFDSAATMLSGLPGTDTKKPDAFTSKILDCRKELGDIYRAGVSIVLEDIAKSSITPEKTIDFFEGLAKLGKPGKLGDLTIATLNYDGAVHSFFLDKHKKDVNDLADGRPEARHQIELVDGMEEVPAQELRTYDSLMPERIAILQLHGSLGWLRHPEGSMRRFTLADLHRSKYWENWRAGQTQWEPLVVLTDQKKQVIERQPFALAYEIFADKLKSAERILIAGYGLGDEPVNDKIREVLKGRKPKPRVLLVDYDKDNREEKKRELEAKAKKVLGGVDLSVSLAGVQDVIGTGEWKEWKAP